MLDSGDVDIAAHDESNLFTIRTYHHFGGAIRHWHGFGFGCIIGDRDSNRHLSRLSGAGRQQINLAIKSEAQITIPGRESRTKRDSCRTW